ncbi:unnamed protein product, partial [Sphacelaria rigidula]
ITTTLELRGRTAEEGGDKQACTNGLIPKIHRRLRDQYPNAHRKQGQTACWNAGARGQARTAKASSASSRGTSTPRPPQGGGRGARDWLSASGKEPGAGGRGAGAEWRLCDPSVAHCSQRNAPGSEYSCGYRNIQMLCSALMDIPEYRRVLFGGSGCVPGVLLMQCWLERAWADGYDPDGCEQLGGAGSLVGSEKWIGATECATLLRSFGVKAEVIDFETDTSVRARTRDSRGQAPASQENRRPPRTGDQDIPATQHQEQNNEPDRGHNQPSLLSYWSSPPGNGGHKLGTDEGSSRITGGNGVVRPDTATHIARDEADACSDRSTRGPLRGLTGGRGNGHLEFPYGSASGRAAPVATGGRQQRGRGEGGRGGRGRGRGQALRASSSSSNSNTSNASAMMGTGCGQAVVEWAWDYFCTPWNVGGEEESLVGKSESSSAAAVGYSRGGKSCQVRGRPRRQDGGERSSAGISRRLPPPLYLQHDGHSRTVVGVLWPQGRSTAGLGGDAATSRGRRSGSGSVGRECARRCPGSLLVFDPSHAGSELRGALANEGNMRWCSFVKRGVRSLRRQQFQMVAVRPGLVDPSEAGMWKKIVATKVRVPDGA